MPEPANGTTALPPAERAARHRDGVTKKLDLVLSELSAMRRKLDALEPCPVAQLASERQAQARAFGAALHQERNGR